MGPKQFVYVGKHTKGVSLDLPTRSVAVEHGVAFDVTDDEAEVLEAVPDYIPATFDTPTDSESEGDED